MSDFSRLQSFGLDLATLESWRRFEAQSFGLEAPCLV